MAGSVFIRQYQEKLIVESPGGLPHGISLDNILDRQVPRNRRIAEILALCGLVERSGQGMNIIYETSIKEAKQLPDFTYESGDGSACKRIGGDDGEIIRNESKANDVIEQTIQWINKVLMMNR